MFGVPNFFVPRMPPPLFWPSGDAGKASYYDNSPLQATLHRLVDFDLLNAGAMRFSVGAVNVAAGNFAYFDYDDAQDPGRAHHGQRLAAARLSGDRGRRRVLLGRRSDLQHAAAMGVRQPAAAGHAGVPGRPLERARCAAQGPDRGRGAAEGDRLFEPDPRGDRSIQECAEASDRGRQPHQASCRKSFANSEDVKLLAQPRPTTRSATSSI